MPKMRLGWYAGASALLTGSVILSAFYQRPNFYSAMAYLSQSNFCLLVLINFILLLYSSFIWSLIRVCFGRLRPVEVEQLTERAWFAITETCLAMTIFREEIGAWFLIMFTALVTGKVWGWISDGRVEILEQQPPANIRLFHFRSITSQLASLIYNGLILRYTIQTVYRQARPNMMVMFLFEFGLVTVCAWRTAVRYALTLVEQEIVRRQTAKRLRERRNEVRQQREALTRQREAAAASGESVSEDQEPLPNEDDIDEMDIEVPGWAAKGEWVLWLDLLIDMAKLGIYVAFFLMLLMFYGLPIHIMRDLFLTSRDFIKRLNALLRYRRAIQDMNKYPDATEEELARENTCIICREEMHHWNPAANPGAVDRVRPKKLPCGHILHLGCLKSWLERQQVCPTCRRPVTDDRTRQGQTRAALRIQIGAHAQRAAGQQAPNNLGDVPGQMGQDNNNNNNNDNNNNIQQNDQAGQRGGPRVFNLGPIRLGFGANGQQVRELAQQFGMEQPARDPAATPGLPPVTQYAPTGNNFQDAGHHLQQAQQVLQAEMQTLQIRQQELQLSQLLMAELQRVRMRQQQEQHSGGQNQAAASHNPPGAPPVPPVQQPPYMPGQAAFPHFPGAPPFSATLPRVNSPALQRLGVSQSTSAIPAGSPDLPEGVVLPPGWSLMPLQRLDGAQNVTSTSASPAPAAATTPAETGQMEHNQSAPGAGTNSDDTSSPVPANLQTSQAERPLSDSSHNQDARPAPQNAPIVAPDPVAPNWAGSAQLFGSGSRSDLTDASGPASTDAAAAAAANYDEASNTAVSTTPGPAPSSHEGRDEAGEGGSNLAVGSDKGEAKAATVEDVDDAAE